MLNRQIILYTLFAVLCLNFKLSAQVFSLPYSNDFESGSPGWVTSTNGSTLWELGSPNYGSTNSSHSGNNCWDINLDTSYTNNAYCSLVSPEFDVSNSSSLYISFWQNRRTEGGWDGAILQYTTDTVSGLWGTVGTNWYTDNQLNSSNLPAWEGDSQGWIQVSETIPNPSSTGSLWLRFLFTSDQAVVTDGFSIDDFHITKSDVNSALGTVYLDVNSSLVIDSMDTPLPHIILNCSSSLGTSYVTSDSLGNYSFLIPNGISNSITANTVTYSYAFPSSHNVLLTGTNLTSYGNDFLITFAPGVIDVKVDLWNNGIRPGFGHYKVVTYKNVGTSPVSGTIELAYDNALTFTSTSVPYSVTGSQTLEFPYSTILPGETNQFIIYFVVDSNAVMGSQTYTTAIIDPLATDNYTTNNYDTLLTFVTNSCDPNEKIVEPPGDISTLQVSSGMELNYLINFQNIGNSEAIHVNIYDFIDEDLDIATFEITGTSHPLTSWQIGTNRQMQFTFANINLPDSTTDEIGSHGFISYKIRPYTFLQAGIVISNTAIIIFDNNLPINTNTTETYILIPSGIPAIKDNSKLLLFPNPNSGSFYLQAGAEFNKLTVYNAIGQQVISQNIDTPGDLQQITLKSLPQGLYLVMVAGNNSSATTTLIIE